MKVIKILLTMLLLIFAFNKTVFSKSTELVALVEDEIWDMVFISDTEMLFTQKEGKLGILNVETQEITEITNVPDVESSRQGGLLDVELDNNFSYNNIIYFSYSAKHKTKEGTNLIIAKAILNKEEMSLNDVTNILIVEPNVDSPLHYSARIAVENNNTLIVSVGDRFLFDPAQDTSSLLGSLIRIHTDGTVPKNNPFVNDKDFNPLIYSYGHRNVLGLTIHNNEIYINENGPKGGDKITKIVKGANYGWPLVSYGVNYDGTPVGEGNTSMEGLQEADINLNPVAAPSSMVFYSGDIYPDLKDKFLMPTLKLQSLYALDIIPHEGVQTIEDVATKINEVNIGRIRSITISNDGYVYLGTTDSIYKLMP